MDTLVPVREPPAPFGPGAAVALLAGCTACLHLPALPSVRSLVPALVGGALLWAFGRRSRPAGIFACGFALAGLHAATALALRLPPVLEGTDVVVTGTIVDLPRAEPGRVRFRLRVDDGHADPGGIGKTDDGEAAPPALQGRLLQLGWYLHGRAASHPPVLKPGARWRLPLRVRAPRGLRNPGTNDAEMRAFADRIAATGYVRGGGKPRQLGPPRGIDAWRDRMSTRIAASMPSRTSRFVRALALGDTRGLDDADWTTLRAAGLTHLIAISGSHVALAAGAIALLVAAAWWLWPALGRAMPRMQAAAIAAAAGALGYAAVAGFALPTMRTVVMIWLVVFARLLRRAQRAADTLAIALIAMLAADPLSVLAPGFWLSFGGVAWLLWCLPGNGTHGWRAHLGGFFGAQAVATIGLLPLTVMLFGQASLAGPVANMIAIPWWSFVVVPLALAGTGLEALHAGLGGWAWRLAARAFDLPWPGFEWIGHSALALWSLPEPAWYAVPLALAGAAWLLLPRGVPGKPLALLLWLPLLWPQRGLPPQGEAVATVIDVGQGLSVLVRTTSHALLYDTGPASPDGYDAGGTVVVPALQALGVRGLDAIVLSHGDSDHAGGYRSVAAAFPPRLQWSPEGMPPGRFAPPVGVRAPPHADCRAGARWEWDGVEFRFLHPPRWFPYLDNDSSCVLRVRAAGGAALLLPGDIDAVVERMLVRRERGGMRAGAVLVAHHGSRGSSDPAFIAALGASWALVSAGAHNRFGHPDPGVVARWRRAGARLEATGATGAQTLRLSAAGIAFQAERRRRPRLWAQNPYPSGEDTRRASSAGTGEGGRLAHDPAAAAVGRRPGDRGRALLEPARAHRDAAGPG
jgi:competence protein ComEC